MQSSSYWQTVNPVAQDTQTLITCDKLLLLICATWGFGKRIQVLNSYIIPSLHYSSPLKLSEEHFPIFNKALLPRNLIFHKKIGLHFNLLLLDRFCLSVFSFQQLLQFMTAYTVLYCNKPLFMVFKRIWS